MVLLLRQPIDLIIEIKYITPSVFSSHYCYYNYIYNYFFFYCYSVNIMAISLQLDFIVVMYIRGFYNDA